MSLTEAMNEIRAGRAPDLDTMSIADMQRLVRFVSDQMSVEIPAAELYRLIKLKRTILFRSILGV